MKSLMRWLASPANWCGLGLASVVLGLKGAGLLGTLGLGMAVVGYGAGFVVGGLWFGFPSNREPAWEALEFSDEGDTRDAMERALTGVRRLVDQNPGQRIPAALRTRVLALCQSLDALLTQWEGSKGTLSLQDSFHARHIAIRYLPEMLNTYLSIPAEFAATQQLDNGKTAVETFQDTLVELETKVRQLRSDLAGQDAQAFLEHSRFLNQKFAPQGLDAPALNLPSTSPTSPTARKDAST